MSAFVDQMSLDMNKVPKDTLERAYWRRRLPPAFRFFLEMLARELLLNRPQNTYAHSADFFEQLLIQRDTELSLLPYEPYFDKLMRKRGLEPRPKAARPSPTPTAVRSASPSAVRCVRCGGLISKEPTSAIPRSDASPRATSPTPARKTPDSDTSSIVKCARCGVNINSPEPGKMGAPPVEMAGATGNHIGQPATYPDYQIIARPFEKDAWGMLMGSTGRYKDDDNEELINSRSLSILMDY